MPLHPCSILLIEIVGRRVDAVFWPSTHLPFERREIEMNDKPVGIASFFDLAFLATKIQVRVSSHYVTTRPRYR